MTNSLSSSGIMNLMSMRLIALLGVALFAAACSPVSPSANEGGDGIPFEGAYNSQTYELNIATEEHRIGIGFSNEGVRKTDIFDKNGEEFLAGIYVTEVKEETTRLFSASNFSLRVEEFAGASGAQPLKFSANVSIESIHIDEDYFTNPFVPGVGVLVFSCATKTYLLPFAGGDGSSDSPFLICTSAQLANMKEVYRTKSFKLMSNLDLSAGGLWEPLANSLAPFTGVFDGSGYSITGLTINKSENNVGLFSYTKNATIRNLILNNVDIKGNSEVGALVGTAEGGQFTNIQISGSVETKLLDNLGGMVGLLSSATPSQCVYNIDFVSAQVDLRIWRVNSGGLVGKINCTGSTSGITRSSTSGSIQRKSGSSVASNNLGGLVGEHKGGTIQKSSSSINIVSPDQTSGGLVGLVTNSSSQIIDSYATGSVTGNIGAGGLIGSIEGATVLLNNVYSSGSVSASNFLAAGLVPNVSYSNLTIENSFSTSTVSAPSLFGGLAADNTGSTVSIINSKWLNTGGGAADCVGWESSTTGCSAAALESEFHDAAAFSLFAWDFTTIWLAISGGLPELR